MILKVRHNKQWTIIDNVQSLDYSDDFKSRKEDINFNNYTFACIDNPERFTTILMSDATQTNVVEVVEVFYWYCTIFYKLKGYGDGTDGKDGGCGSLIFDRTCYICNDTGSTIEKVNVKHNQNEYSMNSKIENILVSKTNN